MLVFDREDGTLSRARELLGDGPGPHGDTYEFSWVSEGQEACRLLLSGEVDVCLVDYRSVVGAVREAFSEATQNPGSAPVILLYRKSYAHDSELVGELGAVDALDVQQLGGLLLGRTIAYAIDRRRAQRELRYASHHDHTTGLANRIVFRKQLERGLKAAAVAGHTVGLLLVNIDRFKSINETLGDRVGDSLLRTVSRRLNDCIRKIDTVARVGDSEFAVLAESVEDDRTVMSVAERIVAAIRMPMVLEGHELFVSGSVGVALFPRDSTEAETLLRKASRALVAARQSGGNRVALHKEGVSHRVANRLSLDHQLLRALHEKQFYLCYQPQLDTRTHRVVGAEALLRWRHPEQGSMPPGDFVHALEETGLIVPVGEWILQTACEQASRWQRAGWPKLRASVNVSPQQFRDRNLPETVYKALADSKLDPTCLELELTESMLMDGGDAERQLRALKAEGIRVVVDDFGTGYSSLAYLRRFPIDALKVDRVFVRDVMHDDDDAAITRAIIALAHTLRLDVIAEGVDTLEQLGFLEECGCDMLQGFLFSQPLQAEAFVRWVTEHEQGLAESPDGVTTVRSRGGRSVA